MSLLEILIVHLNIVIPFLAELFVRADYREMQKNRRRLSDSIEAHASQAPSTAVQRAEPSFRRMPASSKILEEYNALMKATHSHPA